MRKGRLVHDELAAPHVPPQLRHRHSVEGRGSVALPDTPYAMWVNGDLDYFLGMREKNYAEVVGGEITVSVAPWDIPHSRMVQDIFGGFHAAAHRTPSYPWRPLPRTGVDLRKSQEGVVPNFVVLDRDVLQAASAAHAHHLTPDQVELVVEVTPWSGPELMRPPVGTRVSKWGTYARAGIPYYLLVDRHAEEPRTTLYFEPDPYAGVYTRHQGWAFGETVHLPAPFRVEVDTARWRRCREGLAADMAESRETLPLQGEWPPSGG